jgi:hypothetical protein
MLVWHIVHHKEYKFSLLTKSGSFCIQYSIMYEVEAETQYAYYSLLQSIKFARISVRYEISYI